VGVCGTRLKELVHGAKELVLKELVVVVVE
jgi:hypothetical protein